MPCLLPLFNQRKCQTNILQSKPNKKVLQNRIIVQFFTASLCYSESTWKSICHGHYILNIFRYLFIHTNLMANIFANNIFQYVLVRSVNIRASIQSRFNAKRKLPFYQLQSISSNTFRSYISIALLSTSQTDMLQNRFFSIL